VKDSPTSLSEVQAFLGAVIPSTDPIATDRVAAAETANVVSQGVRLSPIEQLEIYREQYWLRHIGAMKEDFVTVHHLLGDDAFRSLCTGYFAAHPARSFTLRDLGSDFAQFVLGTEPWAKEPLIGDCVNVEWAFVEAFDAPDAPPLDPRSIAEAPEEAWGSARITLHPSVQLVALSYPVHDYRRDVRDEKSPERPVPKPTFLVVYRGPERLMYIDIEPLAFEILQCLSRAEPLAAACEHAALEVGVTDTSELERKVGAWFQSWAAYGWISRVDFNV
jgi:hypothetical protein